MRGLSVVLIALFCGLVLVGCSGEETSSEAETSSPDESATVAIDASGGQRVEVEVEIADDYAERQRGLMERTELAENAIAYIDADERIIDIQDMQPLDETSHPSAEPAMYALEVNQGFFDERGVGVGDGVELPDL